MSATLSLKQANSDASTCDDFDLDIRVIRVGDVTDLMAEGMQMAGSETIDCSCVYSCNTYCNTGTCYYTCTSNTCPESLCACLG